MNGLLFRFQDSYIAKSLKEHNRPICFQQKSAGGKQTNRSVFLRVIVSHNRPKLENGTQLLYRLCPILPSSSNAIFHTSRELRKLHVETNTNSSIMTLSSLNDLLCLLVPQS